MNSSNDRGVKIPRYIVALLIIYIASALTYRALFYSGSMVAPFLALGLLSVFILWKPIIGMAIYLVAYPLVPESASINLAKGAIVILTVYLLGIWLWMRARENQLGKIIKTYKWMYIYFGYLCFSPLLGRINDFSIIDWARDIAPLLSLLLIPVIIDHFRDSKNNVLLVLYFVPLAIGLPQYIGWIRFLPFQVAVMHPSWLFGLGISLFLSNYTKKYFWLYFGIMGLVITVLTTGRTIWITSILMSGLLLYFHSKYKRQALVFFYITCALGVFILSGGINYLPFSQEQKIRLNSLLEYRTDVSYENRMDEFEQSMDLFKKSPIVGVGYGYKYVFWRHYVKDIGPGYMETNYTHNDLTNALAKGGLIGCFLMLMMLYDFFRKLRVQMLRNQFSGRTAWSIVAIIILLSTTLTSMSTPILQSRTATFGLSFLLALGLGYKGADDRNAA